VIFIASFSAGQISCLVGHGGYENRDEVDCVVNGLCSDRSTSY